MVRAAGFLLAILMLVPGCDQPQGFDPNYSEPLVTGYLYRVEYYDHSVDYLREVQVYDPDGLRMVPVVRINGGFLKPYYYRFDQYRYGDENWFPVDSTHRLDVTHYWGEATATVVVPGNFAVNEPRDLSILKQESTLVVAWGSSSRAQWYWLDLYCDYEFYDTNNVWDDYSFNLDTIVTDTLVLVPPERIFPPQVMELIEGDGTALVSAGFGPAVEPGDTGNVSGNAFGFFNAGNEPKENYFFVGTPPKDRRSPLPEERRGRLLERFIRPGRSRFR